MRVHTQASKNGADLWVAWWVAARQDAEQQEQHPGAGGAPGVGGTSGTPRPAAGTGVVPLLLLPASSASWPGGGGVAGATQPCGWLRQVGGALAAPSACPSPGAAWAWAGGAGGGNRSSAAGAWAAPAPALVGAGPDDDPSSFASVSHFLYGIAIISGAWWGPACKCSTHTA